MKEIYTKPESLVEEFKTNDSILTAVSGFIDEVEGNTGM